MLVPPPDLLQKFAAVTGPGEADIEVLETANRALAATRDLLLPRLVTGKLDISEVDLGELRPSETA
jgi:type I restriction enzyme S subunit